MPSIWRKLSRTARDNGSLPWQPPHLRGRGEATQEVAVRAFSRNRHGASIFTLSGGVDLARSSRGRKQGSGSSPLRRRGEVYFTMLLPRYGPVMVS